MSHILYMVVYTDSSIGSASNYGLSFFHLLVHIYFEAKSKCFKWIPKKLAKATNKDDIGRLLMGQKKSLTFHCLHMGVAADVASEGACFVSLYQCTDKKSWGKHLYYHTNQRTCMH